MRAALRSSTKRSRDLREGQKLSGDVAFKLYDTYGFPLDLTQDALRARGIGVDKEAFDAAMQRQRAEARKAWAGSGEAATEVIWFAVKDTSARRIFWVMTPKSRRRGRRASRDDGAAEMRSQPARSGLVILNQTPFYGESGGQVGDTGVLRGPGVRIRVDNTPEKARRSVRA